MLVQQCWLSSSCCGAQAGHNVLLPVSVWYREQHIWSSTLEALSGSHYLASSFQNPWDSLYTIQIHLTATELRSELLPRFPWTVKSEQRENTQPSSPAEVQAETLLFVGWGNKKTHYLPCTELCCALDTGTVKCIK